MASIVFFSASGIAQQEFTLPQPPFTKTTKALSFLPFLAAEAIDVSKVEAILASSSTLPSATQTWTAGVGPYLQTGQVTVPLSGPVTWVGSKAGRLSPFLRPDSTLAARAKTATAQAAIEIANLIWFPPLKW